MNAAAAFAFDPSARWRACAGAEPAREQAVVRAASASNLKAELARERLMHLGRIAVIFAPPAIMNAGVLAFFLWNQAPHAFLLAIICALVIAYALAASLGAPRWARSLKTEAIAWRLSTVSVAYCAIAIAMAASLALLRRPSIEAPAAAMSLTAAALVGQSVLLAPARAAGLLFALVGSVGMLIVMWGKDIPLLVAVPYLACCMLAALLLIDRMSRQLDERVTAILELRHERELGRQLLGDYELGSSDWLWEAGLDGKLRILSQAATHEPKGTLAVTSWQELIRTGSDAGNGAGEEFRCLRRAVQRGIAFRGVVVPLRTRDGTVPLRTRDRVVPLRTRDRVLAQGARGQEEPRAHEGEVWCALSGRPVVDSRGNVIGYRGVASDVTPSLEAERRIRHLARHDPLTGLCNRAAFQEHLETLLAADRGNGGASSQARCGCALFFIDLSGFKCVNDAHGYAVGDALLKALAGRLRAVAAGESFVARLGGNEFALLHPNLDDEAAALLARRLIARLSDLVAIDGLRLRVGARIGIAVAPGHGSDVSALFLSADLALREARGRAGSGAVMFDRRIKAEAGRRSALVVDLGGAVSRNEIGVVFQPIVELGTGRVVSCEALMRWRHATRGPIPPAVFIPLAEQTGLISLLGRHAIEIACGEAASWPSDIALAVNVSPLQFRSPRFLRTVIDALTRSGLAPSRLELEITESVMLDTSRETLDTLTQLRNMGVRIALDDFGTGYASLGYVRSFRVDSLKVDRSFVADHQRPDTRAILKAVVNLASELGIPTVAEGVETEAQRQRLQALGYDRAQGFLFAQPMDAAELPKMFAAAPALAPLALAATETTS